MTKDEAREAAEVLLAFADGKMIQYLDDDDRWLDLIAPTVILNNWPWRIKPELREWEVIEMGGTLLSIRQEGEGDRGWIKVREVLSDE